MAVTHLFASYIRAQSQTHLQKDWRPLHIQLPSNHQSLLLPSFLISKELGSCRFDTLSLRQAYKVSIMFSRNAYLVDIVNGKHGRVLKLNSIASGHLWKGVDLLIFDTWHWWLHTGRKQPWDYVQAGKRTYKDMNRTVAYEKALRTWARWVNLNVDPDKSKVFFQGVSPDHMDSRDRADRTAKTCRGETHPMLSREYRGRQHPAEVILKNVLRSVSKPVHLLDITSLSQLRKDGHPSTFGSGGRCGIDCTHWCLPGVPDAWNELLLAAIFRS
ncbi:hypothetical protein V6N13_028613 [Hibiscus sabdariffa]|uniref:Trichome birefringence-like C-terminal domain-containing protein n=1 Tax=Hibiscus sabdariffa TaxID=183260 RepID=A0ABR2P9F1_9ROSI